jgi:hypothetical protein
MQEERKYATKNWISIKIEKQLEIRKVAEDEVKYGYDCKHAYHFVRLIRMCKKILTTGKVIVKRLDLDELLHIRNGSWTYD